MLPDWPARTVTVLVTTTEAGPHAIPVSAALRAGPRTALLGLARSRATLENLRARPAVTLCVTARDTAFSADGTAAVVDEHLTDAVAAVAIDVATVHDHLRPTFAIRGGVQWTWTDADADARDRAVTEALVALARTLN